MVRLFLTTFFSSYLTLKMSSQASQELTQTQSQSHNTADLDFSNERDDKDSWGRLQAKHYSFSSVGMLN